MVTSHQRAGATWVPIIPEGVTEPLSNDLRKFESRFSTLSLSPIRLCSNLDIIHSPFSSFRSIPYGRVTSERSPLRSPFSLSLSFPLCSTIRLSFYLARSANDFRKTQKPVEEQVEPKRSDTMLIRTASGNASPKRARLSDLT